MLTPNRLCCVLRAACVCVVCAYVRVCVRVCARAYTCVSTYLLSLARPLDRCPAFGLGLPLQIPLMQSSLMMDVTNTSLPTYKTNESVDAAEASGRKKRPPKPEPLDGPKHPSCNVANDNSNSFNFIVKASGGGKNHTATRLFWSQNDR